MDIIARYNYLYIVDYRFVNIEAAYHYIGEVYKNITTRWEIKVYFINIAVPRPASGAI